MSAVLIPNKIVNAEIQSFKYLGSLLCAKGSSSGVWAGCFCLQSTHTLSEELFNPFIRNEWTGKVGRAVQGSHSDSGGISSGHRGKPVPSAGTAETPGSIELPACLHAIVGSFCFGWLRRRAGGALGRPDLEEISIWAPPRVF